MIKIIFAFVRGKKKENFVTKVIWIIYSFLSLPWIRATCWLAAVPSVFFRPGEISQPLSCVSQLLQCNYYINMTICEISRKSREREEIRT